MTPGIIAKYLRLDRAVGHVCDFVGHAVDPVSPDWDSMNKALKELDDAKEDLQKFIYDLSDRADSLLKKNGDKSTDSTQEG